MEAVADSIAKAVPMIPASKKPSLVKMVQKLKDKLFWNKQQSFSLHKQLRGHMQPLTSCGFNKDGSW